MSLKRIITIFTLFIIVTIGLWLIIINMGSNTQDNSVNIFEGSSTINWQPCTQPQFSDWFGMYADTEAMQCAVLDIAITDEPTTVSAINSSNSASTLPTVDTSTVVMQLALSKLPATGSKRQKLGSIISIAGGPGQSGLDVSPLGSKSTKRLSKHFDIIGYAPRGVYPSTPTIACELEDDDTQSKQLEQTFEDDNDAREVAQACWAQTPHALLAQLGADYATTDIEAIRQALGTPKIDLIGYSYGTKIAALYAEKYPDHLRSAVLDGVVDLNDPDVSMLLKQETAIQNSFEQFVTQCRTQIECYFGDTQTLTEAETKLGKLYLQLDNQDIKDFDGEHIYPGNLAWEIVGLLMWQEQWPMLNELLIQLDMNNYDLLRELIDYSKEDMDEAAFVAINCADIAPNDSRKQSYLQTARRINNVSTWDNYKPASDDDLLDACYYWPVTGSDTTHIPKLSPKAPPLLLVAQTQDPATPYSNAVAMQKYLDGILLTRDSNGHTLVLSDMSPCVDKTVVDYLIDPKEFAENHGKNLVCQD